MTPDLMQRTFGKTVLILLREARAEGAKDLKKLLPETVRNDPDYRVHVLNKRLGMNVSVPDWERIVEFAVYLDQENPDTVVRQPRDRSEVAGNFLDNMPANDDGHELPDIPLEQRWGFRPFHGTKRPLVGVDWKTLEG